MVRETGSHDVFVRTVRGEFATRHLGPATVGADPAGEAVGRFVGSSEQPDVSVPSVLARDTLVGTMLRDGTRLASRSAHGVPVTDTQPRSASRMRFSFSRADGIAVCALSPGDPLGVAIESVRRIGPDPLGVSAAICSDRERAFLASTPSSGRPWRFLVMWTLKVAIAKAVGPGLRFPLHRIAVGDGGGISARVLAALLGGRAADWRFATWRPSPFHVAAVAVRSVPGTLIRFGGDLAAHATGCLREDRGAPVVAG